MSNNQAKEACTLTTTQRQATTVPDSCNPSNQYGVHAKPVAEEAITPPPAQPFPRCG